MSRLSDPGFDIRIADWLEADPDLAPPDVMRTVESALPSIPQRRVMHLPWRFPPMNRFAALAATVGLLALAGVAALTAGGRPTTPPPPLPSASPSSVPSPSAAVPALAGRLLVEHLGNAPDLSEKDETGFNPERRRLYIAGTSSLQAGDFTEFLPGDPADGKSAADVAPDGERVVFQTWSTQPRIWQANLDGTGLTRLSDECSACQELYPAYSPDGRRVAYVRIEGDQSWLAIRDLDTGTVTRLESTVGPASDEVPEQPDWSPEGGRLAYSRLTWDGRNEPVVGTVRYGDVAPTGGRIEVVDIAADTVTTLATPGIAFPGDVDWSPDGKRLLMSDGPMSTTGSVANMSHGGTYVVPIDGGAPSRLTPMTGGAAWLPDGERVLLVENEPFVVDLDGSVQPLVRDAMDLSEQAQGFVYGVRWLPAP